MPRKSRVWSESCGGAYSCCAGVPTPETNATANARAAARPAERVHCQSLFMFARGVAFGARVVVHAALAFVAIVVNDLVFRGIAAQRQVHGPRSSEHRWILNRRVVGDGVRAGHLEALDDVLVFVDEIAVHVEPGAPVEVGDIDDESIALPMPARVAVPRPVVL